MECEKPSQADSFVSIASNRPQLNCSYVPSAFAIIVPMFVLKQTPPPENFEAAKASLGEIEEHLKNHKVCIAVLAFHVINVQSQYLATEDKPTIADLFVVPEVDQVRH